VLVSKFSDGACAAVDPIIVLLFADRQALRRCERISVEVAGASATPTPSSRSSVDQQGHAQRSARPPPHPTG
jgi:hypothetical protein